MSRTTLYGLAVAFWIASLIALALWVQRLADHLWDLALFRTPGPGFVWLALGITCSALATNLENRSKEHP